MQSRILVLITILAVSLLAACYPGESTTGWDDVSISMSQVRSPASLSPAWRAYKQSYVPGFSASAVNVLYFSAQLPHSYMEGSDIEFHIHAAYQDALSGNSTWYFSYSWANIGDTFPVPEEVTVYDIPSPELVDTHQLIQIAPLIDGAGKKISSILLCSIQRLGNTDGDNYPSEIYLISGDFHIRKNSIGSYTETMK